MTGEAGVIARPKIEFKGTQLSAELLDDLIDLRVETAVSRPAQATLRFYDYEFKILDDKTKVAIGAQVKISLVGPSGTSLVAVFDGELTSIGVESGPDDVMIAVLIAHDKSHRLGRNSRQRVFAQQTYSDMIKKIVSENGMQATVPALGEKFEHITQFVDDATFITDICRRCGMIWTVTDGKFVVKAAEVGSPDATLTRGESLLRLRAQFDAAELADEVTVRGWDPKSKKEIVSKNATQPTSLGTAPVVGEVRKAATSTFKAEKLTGSNVTGSLSEAQSLAKSLHARSVSDELRVRGETFGNPTIAAGRTIALAKVGSRLSGNYLVTSAEHIYSNRDFVTRFSCGGVQPATLADLVGGGAGGVPPIGAVIGVVSNVGKDEFSGLVKVKLPTIGDNLESTWARVVTPGGGKSRGLQLMPSVDDEVLVVFEQGDLRRPFVLGGLWNPMDALPLSTFLNNSQVTDWTLKDRVGHSLTFRGGQGDDKRNVEVLLADGQTKVYIGQDKVEVFAASGKPLQLKSGEGTITITKDGNIEIKGTKISITGTQEVAVKATNVKVNSDASTTVQANASLELKGSASAKLEGGGMAEIKAAMVKVN